MSGRFPASIRAAARGGAVLMVAMLATLHAGHAALAAGPDLAALQIQPYDPPKPAPAFSLPDLDGKSRSLDDVRGKVVLLFFWATW